MVLRYSVGELEEGTVVVKNGSGANGASNIRAGMRWGCP